MIPRQLIMKLQKIKDKENNLKKPKIGQGIVQTGFNEGDYSNDLSSQQNQ